MSADNFIIYNKRDIIYKRFISTLQYNIPKYINNNDYSNMEGLCNDPPLVAVYMDTPAFVNIGNQTWCPLFSKLDNRESSLFHTAETKHGTRS